MCYDNFSLPLKIHQTLPSAFEPHKNLNIQYDVNIMSMSSPDTESKSSTIIAKYLATTNLTPAALQIHNTDQTMTNNKQTI